MNAVSFKRIMGEVRKEERVVMTFEFHGSLRSQGKWDSYQIMMKFMMILLWMIVIFVH